MRFNIFNNNFYVATYTAKNEKAAIKKYVNAFKGWKDIDPANVRAEFIPEVEIRY
jgi:hypothetical protein